MENVPLERVRASASGLAEFPQSGIRLWKTVVVNTLEVDDEERLIPTHVITLECDTGQEIGLGAARAAEEAALQARYGKFTPEAWERLQTKGDDDLMRVGISVEWRLPGYEGKLQAIQDQMITKYPGTRFADDGVTVVPPRDANLEQQNEVRLTWSLLRYENLWGSPLESLVNLIEGSGYEVLSNGSLSNLVFTAIAPKSLILDLVDRPEVRQIRDREPASAQRPRRYSVPAHLSMLNRYNMAKGLTGIPVIPATRSGAKANINSHRFRSAQAALMSSWLQWSSSQSPRATSPNRCTGKPMVG